jgi:hypothetical protein
MKRKCKNWLSGIAAALLLQPIFPMLFYAGTLYSARCAFSEGIFAIEIEGTIVGKSYGIALPFTAADTFSIHSTAIVVNDYFAVIEIAFARQQNVCARPFQHRYQIWQDEALGKEIFAGLP